MMMMMMWRMICANCINGQWLLVGQSEVSSWELKILFYLRFAQRELLLRLLIRSSSSSSDREQPKCWWWWRRIILWTLRLSLIYANLWISFLQFVNCLLIILNLLLLLLLLKIHRPRLVSSHHQSVSANLLVREDVNYAFRWLKW